MSQIGSRSLGPLHEGLLGMRSWWRMPVASVGPLLVCLALTSCGGSSTPTSDPDAVLLLLEAEQNSFALESVDFQMEMDMAITADEFSMSLDFDWEGTASGDFETFDVSRGTYDLTVDDPELGSQRIEGLVEDNRLSLREQGGDWEDVGTIQELAAEFPGQFTTFSFAELIDKRLVTVKTLGTETIQGTPSQHLRIDYDLERLEEVISEELLPLALGDESIGPQTAIDKVNRFDSGVWISLDDHLIMKQEVEYSFAYSVEDVEFEAAVTFTIVVESK